MAPAGSATRAPQPRLLLPLLLCAASLLAPRCDAAQSVVSNTAPKVDAASGAILDIHDGNTLRIGNTFYWYGASYTNCTEPPADRGCPAGAHPGTCGFNVDHTISLATSTDLVSWSLVGVVLPVENRPPGILFSPWVARSASTGLYVLWVNILPVLDGQFSFDAAYYSVYTSATPQGPFVMANKNVSGVAYSRLPDAASVFVDDDGSAFLAFTHEDDHVNTVQELSPDLLGPKPGGAVSPQIGGTNNEGTLMFKRDGLYYVAFGQCCCFCGEGSNVEVHVATSPAGVYNKTGDIVSRTRPSAYCTRASCASARVARTRELFRALSRELFRVLSRALARVFRALLSAHAHKRPCLQHDSPASRLIFADAHLKLDRADGQRLVHGRGLCLAGRPVAERARPHQGPRLLLPDAYSLCG